MHRIGHSYGAFVCLLLAVREPTLARTFVLAEPPVVTLFVRNAPKASEILRLTLRRPRTAAAIVLVTWGLVWLRRFGQAYRADMNQSHRLVPFVLYLAGQQAHARHRQIAPPVLRAGHAVARRTPGGRSMLKIVPALVCLLFGTACSPAPSGDPDRVLIALEDQWAHAVRQGDVTALDTIIADGYVGTTATGQVQRKAEYLADFGTGDRRVFTLTTDDLDVRIYGHVAVLTHGGHAQGEVRGRPVDGAFRWTHVFVERDGRWQAVANHVTKIPAP